MVFTILLDRQAPMQGCKERATQCASYLRAHHKEHVGLQYAEELSVDTCMGSMKAFVKKMIGMVPKTVH